MRSATTTPALVLGAGFHSRKLGPDPTRGVARDVGIVAGERMERGALELGGHCRGVFDPRQHAPSDGIGGAASDGVVELGPKQRAPGRIEDGTPIASPVPSVERDERFGHPLQPELGFRMPPLERRPGAVYALQSPGITV